MEYQKRRFWKYKLYADETYSTGIKVSAPINTQFIWMTVEGILTVKKGYTWDGASGPTLDTKNTMTPSLIHDALYQLMRMGLLDRRWRKQADEILYEMLRIRKTWKVRAKTWYRMVRRHASQSSKYNVITVLLIALLFSGCSVTSVNRQMDGSLVVTHTTFFIKTEAPSLEVERDATNEYTAKFNAKSRGGDLEAMVEILKMFAAQQLPE